MDQFTDWFKAHHGTIDAESMVLTDIPGQGRGAIALRDIPEGHTLFTIPRDLTLSMRTSTLPSLLGERNWRKFQLHKGWAGIILCMMWEETRGDDSKWSVYLRSMPTQFNTPMFWTTEELDELVGTTVREKIGKEEAEKDYREKLLPAIQNNMDLFRPEHLDTYYSLQNYHTMGSRILSRCFHVEKWEGDEEDEPEEDKPGADDHDLSHDGMEVDEELSAPNEPVVSDGSEGVEAVEEDDEDDEDPSDVAMVPMADMLNARYGSENAKLFYEPTELNMITTKAIKAGDQIYNTYGDPPNADLLRRYGHVDVIPVSEGGDGEGSPADEVEIPANLSLAVVADRLQKDSDDASLRERIDWWLEEGEEDIFALKRDLAPPEGLISFSKLFLLSAEEWGKAKAKSKPPKPKLDGDVLPVLLGVLKRRLSQYPTSTEDDAKLLQDSSLPYNKRNAIIVRLSEKRILHAYLTKLGKLQTEAPGNAKKINKEKRKRAEEGQQDTGKRKRK